MNILLRLGQLAGVCGALLGIIGAAFRLSGNYYVSVFQVGTIFQASIAVMVFGCLCLLAVLTHRL